MNASRNLERALRREQVRSRFRIGGILFISFGLAVALIPFGPKASNPDVIPKADPAAGLALIQGMETPAIRLAGVVIALIGALALAYARSYRVQD